MPDNGMHPTADTSYLNLSQRCGAAVDTGRCAAPLSKGVKVMVTGLDTVAWVRRMIYEKGS